MTSQKKTRAGAETRERDPWLEIALLNSPPNACYSETVAQRMKRHSPPYRAEFAGKGDERDWPWMVVGAPGWNMLGVLHSKQSAHAMADLMNRAALKTQGEEA